MCIVFQWFVSTVFAHIVHALRSQLPLGSQQSFYAAWIRPVEIPTSALKPNLKPSANLVDAFLKTQAASTRLRNSSPAGPSSEQMITSVWQLPYLWIQAIASSILSTTPTIQVRSPYSQASIFCGNICQNHFHDASSTQTLDSSRPNGPQARSYRGWIFRCFRSSDNFLMTCQRLSSYVHSFILIGFRSSDLKPFIVLSPRGCDE